MMVNRIQKFLGKKLLGGMEKSPQEAYDLWASSYDSQPDNLMLALDEEVFSSLLNNIHLENKVVVDIGCGTGRHWLKLLNKQPQKIIGFDVSEKMLEKLQHKIPFAETHQLLSNQLSSLQNNSVDVIVSTLSIAHIKNIEEALEEWIRVLKPGGNMIITDYHPTALSMGADRTFSYDKKTIAIVNYVHSLEKIIAIAEKEKLQMQIVIQKKIDESMKPYYEKHNAVVVFNRWKDVPIIYGIHFKKADDIK